MALYTYEYFCGANVVVAIEGMELHEAAGISFGVQESKMPLYGYSSRHFDAIARGQVLVQGSLLVNYIHQDYLYRAIQTGREQVSEIVSTVQNSVDPNAATTFTAEQAVQDLHFALQNEAEAQAFADTILQDPSQNQQLIAAFQGNYWDTNAPAFGVAPTFDSLDPTGINPHDLNSTVDIKITFGNRSPFNNNNGLTGLLLSGVYFVGRGVPIQIDEEVIVEEYSFIGRNLHSLNTVSAISGDFSGGELDVKIFGREGPQELLFGDVNPNPSFAPLTPVSTESQLKEIRSLGDLFQ